MLRNYQISRKISLAKEFEKFTDELLQEGKERPLSRFFVPSFRFSYPCSGFWGSMNTGFCALVPVIGVQKNLIEAILFETTPLRTPDRGTPVSFLDQSISLYLSLSISLSLYLSLSFLSLSLSLSISLWCVSGIWVPSSPKLRCHIVYLSRFCLSLDSHVSVSVPCCC